MEKETLDKINRLTRREFTESELYTFSVILCDNEIDRDCERFSDEALEQLKSLYIGKTGIFDHDPKGSNQSARIYDTEVVTDSTRTTKYGAPYKCLKAWAYMVRTDGNRDLITEIEAGIKKEVSVGVSVASMKCSICGSDRTESRCSHQKGESYGDQLCHIVLDEITDAYEWSFVAVPAQPAAGVTKKYSANTTTKGGKTMEFTPITTQEAFDTAVKERLDAAVSEAEKRFEGWASPETVAALTKERDDSKTAVADLTAKQKASELSILKMRVAAEKGIPLELAEKLSGDTEKSVREDAEKLAKYVASANKRVSSPMFSGEPAMKDPIDAAYISMLQEINN